MGDALYSFSPQSQKTSDTLRIQNGMWAKKHLNALIYHMLLLLKEKQKNKHNSVCGN